jgi:hypothetical protein
MIELSGPERALADIAHRLTEQGKSFALVGGLAVSVRGEVRFTRDVDVVVAVADDSEAEQLVFALRAAGYRPGATVEHRRHGRLASARLMSPAGVVVDLLFASCGIEQEIAARATRVELPLVGSIPVARAEELLSMKVLSMTNARLQDELDARRLLQLAPVDLHTVRANLRLITERQYHRDQDLDAKLATLLSSSDVAR